MLKKDLLVRQMEEFGKVLSLILSFKRNKDWEQFERALEEAVRSYTSHELGELTSSDLETFEKNVILSSSLSLIQKKILAGLLFEKLEQPEPDEKKYKALQKKCKGLYQFLADDLTENEYNLDIHFKLNVLKRMEDPNS